MFQFKSANNLASVASVSVWFQSKRGLSVLTAREMKREQKNFSRGLLTLVPHSLLLNRTETLATQATCSNFNTTTEINYLLHFWSDGCCSRIYIETLSADHTDWHISHTGNLVLKHIR